MEGNSCKYGLISLSERRCTEPITLQLCRFKAKVTIEGHGIKYGLLCVLYAARSCYKIHRVARLQTEFSTCTFSLPASGDFCGQPGDAGTFDVCFPILSGSGYQFLHLSCERRKSAACTPCSRNRSTTT